MARSRRQIYRPESLQRLAEPEHVDHLLRVVRRPTWLLLSSLGVVTALALGWSVAGRVPVSAGGSAVLVRPKQVVSFQAAADGRVLSVEVAPGDAVRPGAALLRLALPALEKEQEQERLRLEQFEQRSAEVAELKRELGRSEQGFLARQRDLLTQRIGDLRGLAASGLERSLELIDQQRSNIATARKLSEELRRTLEERHAAYVTLELRGLLAEDSVVEARMREIDKELRLAELDVEEQELRLRESQAQETYERQMDLVQDLEFQLADLELREMELNRELREDELAARAGRDEITLRIELLEARLEREGWVRAEEEGRVLELSALVGQHVRLGDRLGKIEIEDADAALRALAYFEVRSGKKVRPGQRILVTPATVQRERAGSLIGRVLRVSDYPVTTEAAASQIGDLELARALMGGRSRIEVLAALETDARTPTGFRWTSGHGPRDLEVTAGTTADVRVTIEERSPLSFVLPFLRSAAGG